MVEFCKDMRIPRTPLLAVLVGALALGSPACDDDDGSNGTSATDIQNGRDIFRNDTFGDERHWTDRLQMHTVIESAVDPVTALSVGLKVDSEALPPGTLETADLRSPATTVALLKLNAVVGVRGQVVSEGGRDRLVQVGVTCALCHSTVDNSVAPGIGRRLDGWQNSDLNPGAIIALSPALTAEQKAVYNSWGKGFYDPRFNIDGRSTPIVIPPAYGLAGVDLATHSGDGDVRYWNHYVSVTQMGAQGSFSDDRIGVNITLPPGTPDLVQAKLDGLRDYQLSIPAPAPEAGSFDAAAAQRGRAAFEQTCARCHSGPNRTDNRLHAPAETGMDPTYASRTATKLYRTTPLRALQRHPPYFHDGSATTLDAVVAHYQRVLGLDFTAAQTADLVEYLKSL